MSQIPTAKLASRPRAVTVSRYGLCTCGEPLQPGLNRKGGRLTRLLCLKESRVFPPPTPGQGPNGKS